MTNDSREQEAKTLIAKHGRKAVAEAVLEVLTTPAAKYTLGQRRAIALKKPTYYAGAKEPINAFVLADNKTVVGRFHRYEDALLDSAAPSLYAAAKGMLDLLRSTPEMEMAAYVTRGEAVVVRHIRDLEKAVEEAEKEEC